MPNIWRISERKSLSPVYLQPAPRIDIPNLETTRFEDTFYAKSLGRKEDREARMAELDAQLANTAVLDDMRADRELSDDAVKRERNRADLTWKSDFITKRGAALGARRKRVSGMMGFDVGGDDAPSFSSSGRMGITPRDATAGSVLNALSMTGRGDMDPVVGPTLPPRDPRRMKRIDGSDQYRYDTAPEDEIDLDARAYDSMQQWKLGKKVSPEAQDAFMDARRSVESQELQKERGNEFVAGKKRLEDAKPKDPKDPEYSNDDGKRMYEAMTPYFNMQDPVDVADLQALSDEYEKYAAAKREEGKQPVSPGQYVKEIKMESGR
jgi:hypothetical protein